MKIFLLFPILFLLTITAIAQDRATRFWESGTYKMENEDYENAISDFNKAIRADRNFFGAYLNRGLSKYSLEQYDDAIKDFNIAIQLDSTSYMPFLDRALAEFGLARYDASIADLKKVLRLNPDYTLAYASIGFCHVLMKKPEEAITYYDKYIKLDSTNEEAYASRGSAKMMSFRFTEAIIDLNKAIQLKPDFELAYNNRGLTYHFMADYKNAIADFNKLIEINAINGEAYLNRGRSKNMIGQFKEAIIDFETALQMKQPSYENLTVNYYADIHNARGYARYKLGYYADAILDYDKAIKEGGPAYSPYNHYRDESVAATQKHTTSIPGSFTHLVWLAPEADPAKINSTIYNAIASKLPIKARIISKSPIKKEQLKLLVNNQSVKFDTLVDITYNQTGAYYYDVLATPEIAKGFSTIKLQDNDAATPELRVNYAPRLINLHVVSIGVNGNGLNYAENDAADFTSLFSGQTGTNKIFNTVNAKTLKRETAKAANICIEIGNLTTKGLNPNDVLLLFISSHGGLSDENKLYIPGSDYDKMIVRQTTVDFKTQIIDPLKQLHCKVFIFLDACNSGTIIKDAKLANPGQVNKEIAKLLDAEDDITVITSSDEKENSWEDASWKNGAFTKTLKEALLTGKADTNKDDIISINELFAYISKQVPLLVEQANKKNNEGFSGQHPQMFNRKGDVAIYIR